LIHTAKIIDCHISRKDITPAPHHDFPAGRGRKRRILFSFISCFRAKVLIFSRFVFLPMCKSPNEAPFRCIESHRNRHNPTFRTKY